ncbi:hypothetical protein EJ110_NYTH51919 [Nymphaea thermarum]|nr:hypothetical protein EJ110_NYTH51919 [Nymphaea thermarum]
MWLCDWETSPLCSCHWSRLFGAQAVQGPRVLADPGQQVEQMASLTSYWGGDGSPDKAEEWIEEIERIFEVLEVPGGNKVKYGSYMLKGDAQRWWKSTREIQFADQQTISWRQFRDSFFSTYFAVQARNKKMQEFLDLQQNHLSLEEYVTKYRHLEAYCPHLYTTAEARADKFIYGLRDGLRGRVMSSNPRNLDEAVTRARRMEEDWVKTQRDHQKKTSQHSQGGRMPVKHHHPAGRARPYERRDDRTFRRNRPGRSETTQGSVVSPTSPRCPTCSRAHPGKQCYQVTGACLHCGGSQEGQLKGPAELNSSGDHASEDQRLETGRFRRRALVRLRWSASWARIYLIFRSVYGDELEFLLLQVPVSNKQPQRWTSSLGCQLLQPVSPPAQASSKLDLAPQRLADLCSRTTPISKLDPADSLLKASRQHPGLADSLLKTSQPSRAKARPPHSRHLNLVGSPFKTSQPSRSSTEAAPDSCSSRLLVQDVIKKLVQSCVISAQGVPKLVQPSSRPLLKLISALASSPAWHPCFAWFYASILSKAGNDIRLARTWLNKARLSARHKQSISARRQEESSEDLGSTPRRIEPRTYPGGLCQAGFELSLALAWCSLSSLEAFSPLVSLLAHRELGVFSLLASPPTAALPSPSNESLKAGGVHRGTGKGSWNEGGSLPHRRRSLLRHRNRPLAGKKSNSGRRCNFRRRPLIPAKEDGTALVFPVFENIQQGHIGRRNSDIVAGAWEHLRSAGQLFPPCPSPAQALVRIRLCRLRPAFLPSAIRPSSQELAVEPHQEGHRRCRCPTASSSVARLRRRPSGARGRATSAGPHLPLPGQVVGLSRRPPSQSAARYRALVRDCRSCPSWIARPSATRRSALPASLDARQPLAAQAARFPPVLPCPCSQLRGGSPHPVF